MSKQYVNLAGLTVYDDCIKNYIDQNAPDLIKLTQVEYDALPEAEKLDPNKYYFITDAGDAEGTLEELTDTAISNPSNGQVLAYDSSNQMWRNQSVITGARVSNEVLILF